jgi:hypothetical protein
MPAATGFLSVEARTYGLRQLARRAGVSEDWFSTWLIEHGQNETVVRPWAGKAASIRFQNAPADRWEQLGRGDFAVARASWPDDAPAAVRRAVSQFLVPYADREISGPLFKFGSGELEATCQLDLLASIVLTLSRYEETLPGTRDRHGRFPDRASLAVKHGFATRPIVDEYGLGFQQVLQRLCPGWQPEPRRLQVNLTHDVDEIGIPFKLRIAGRRCVRAGAGAGLREIAAAFGAQPTALAAVLETTSLAGQRGLGCAVYWKSSPPSEFDSGYAIQDRRVAAVIGQLERSGFELGVHPGYTTYLNRDGLGEEVDRLRRAFGTSKLLGGRQHFLRWSPQTWKDWEACGLGYDSSVGFSECVGFRAGTCYPYRPWLLDQDRQAELLEVPLLAMDCTLTGPMGLRSEQCLEPLQRCLAACQLVGGVFTLLWHTDSILEPVYGDAYDRILELLAREIQFDWRKTASENYA